VARRSPKFEATCLKDGIEVTPELSKLAVDTFRQVNNRIVSYWYAIEDAAVEAVRSPGQIVAHGRVKFRVNGSFLWCQLPSGRNLCYPYPKLKEKMTPWGEMKPAVFYKTVNSYTRQWGESDTYGGKLVENITQAVARDLMAEGMLRVEAAGYPVIMTVHDEIMAEPPEGFGSKEEFESLMAKLPDWAQGCPVAAKGWIGKRYRK
jgi:DNA polymerase bacteriophage-type